MRALGTRHLGMADAGAGGHQVELAGAHHRVHPCAVPVLDLAAEQPADGLQPGVRMRRNVHARARSDVVRTVVVGEAPRADERSLPLWQGAADPDGPRPAKGHLARMQHTGET